MAKLDVSPWLGLLCTGAFALAGCGDSGTIPDPPDTHGVDFAALFAPPTDAEEAAVRSDWGARDPAALDVTVAVDTSLSVGGSAVSLRVVSHTVDAATHHGAVLVPDAAAPGSLPVLMYLHGGDGGLNVDQLLPLLPLLVSGVEESFVLVAPAFRSEPLVYAGQVFQSTGDASPWDRDVDDALALLESALDLVPAANPDRIGIVGFSRGAAVGLLMAVRDPRIDAVVDFFGPTDFFGSFVQEVTREALDGNPRDLPGLDVLDARFLQPLARGELSIAEMRIELLRRSPVYFAEDLSAVQVHHGTADATVPVGEGRRLIDVMTSLGRVAPEFEGYIYTGGTHTPLTLSGSLDRTEAFLDVHLSAAATAPLAVEATRTIAEGVR